MAAPAAVVTAFLKSFAAGDPDTIAGFVSDDFVNEHLSALGTGCAGRAEYQRRLPEFLSSFTDRDYSIEELVEQPAATGSESDVVVRYRFVARCAGRRIDIPGVMWFTVRRGLITRRVDVWDSLTFLVQTGQR